MNARRTLVLGLASLSAAVLAGCASNAVQSSPSPRTYCIRRPHGRRPICAEGKIPSADVEAQAKRFEPRSDALTLYIVRGRYANAPKRVPVRVDEAVELITLPRSMARLRLAPGHHVLSLEWDGTVRRHAVDGAPGEVRFVELTGSAWPWDLSYYWSEADPLGTRERALRSRLIADL